MKGREDVILVVDDSRSVRVLIQEQLERRGYGVETASDGEEALQKIPSFRPVMVLSDLMMPRMDGLELLKRVREMGEGCRPEVIIMTAHRSIHKAVEAMKNGAYDFLLKPVDFLHLESILERCSSAILLKKENKELALLNELKDEFIALVNHEFRTPVGIILASYKILEMKLEETFQGNSGPERREDFGTVFSLMKKATDRLVEIMEKFSDFSLLEKGHLRLISSCFCLDALLDEVMASICLLARERKLVIEADKKGPPLQIKTDRTKLFQVLWELLQNAVKYTPDGGMITLAREILEDNAGKWAVVSVKDTGIGIPMKAQPLIFDKFFEVQSALYHSTSPSGFMGGGLGLGLSYVNQVVQLMKGKVSLESREDHGTVFKVWLPMNNGAFNHEIHEKIIKLEP